MWDGLPLDLLAYVFSFLPPDSLARAMSTCRHWHACVLSHPFPRGRGRKAAACPWFLAMHARAAAATNPPCYVYSKELRRWHALPLDFLPFPIRLVAPVTSGLLLCRLASAGGLRLLLCNPFTRQHKLLPPLIVPRSNPAVGVIPDCAAGAASFRVYVAGGATVGGYEPTLEVYDSRVGGWRRTGATPAGFAVRLTVWTPNESVVAGGIVYWMTSARAYSVMGLEVATGDWREVKAPLADRLEWAALVARRSGRLGLVGGCGQGEGKVWELGEGDEWVIVGVVPAEVAGKRWRGGGGIGSATRCVGGEGAVYLYGDVGKHMVVGSDVGSGEERWEWVEGFCYTASSVGGEKGVVGGLPIKGVLFHPNVSPACLKT